MNIHNGYTDVLLLLFLLLSRFPFVQLSSSTSSFIQFSLEFGFTIPSHHQSLFLCLAKIIIITLQHTGWPPSPTTIYPLHLGDKRTARRPQSPFLFIFFFVFSVFLDEEFSHLHRTTTVQQLDDDDDGTL